MDTSGEFGRARWVVRWYNWAFKDVRNQRFWAGVRELRGQQNQDMRDDPSLGRDWLRGQCKIFLSLFGVASLPGVLLLLVLTLPGWI